MDDLGFEVLESQYYRDLSNEEREEQEEQGRLDCTSCVHFGEECVCFGVQCTNYQKYDRG